MTTLDLKLPRHLYRQTLNEDGEVTAITYPVSYTHLTLPTMQ